MGHLVQPAADLRIAVPAVHHLGGPHVRRAWAACAAHPCERPGNEQDGRLHNQHHDLQGQEDEAHQRGSQWDEGGLMVTVQINTVQLYCPCKEIYLAVV